MIHVISAWSSSTWLLFYSTRLKDEEETKKDVSVMLRERRKSDAGRISFRKRASIGNLQIPSSIAEKSPSAVK